MRAPRELLALAAFALLALAACKSGAPADVPAHWPAPRAGAIATEHPLATQAGLDVLNRGGNAADAAVAAALVLAVVHPHAGNLGGGGFARWVPHAGEPDALDFRETAPRAVDPALYLDTEGKRVGARSLRGPHAVAVPGSPRGLWELHQKHGSGKLRFAELARRAIELAQQGFPVDAFLARDLVEPGVRAHFSPSAQAVFYPGGEALREGAVLRQSPLAEALALLANEGPDAFYSGSIAAAIVRELDATPVPGSDATGRGWMTAADLAGYAVRSEKPLRGWFRGLEIVTMPPPSSGGVVLLQVLGILEGLPLDAERDRAIAEQALAKNANASSVERGFDERMAHWWIESLRAAFADRAKHLGDPRFHPVPLKELLSSEWISERRIGIGERARPETEAWEAREGKNTTHLSVLDRAGNAVSLTTTLNDTFGSGLFVRQYGFLLNDEMDDFALQAGTPNLYGLVGGSANAPAAGKRPLSSMTPTVLREGGHANVLVLGSPGGPRIITSVLEVILRTTLLGETLEDAVARPRFHQQWSPPATEFETGFDPAIVEALEKRRGHPVKRDVKRFGSVQAIQLPELGGTPRAVSDPRRGGSGAVQ
ncbi:MAG: gamma-glutamyltransferase [Planctomycetes bacterium]|nr:gamma-glutamyltransferase [Planctomycetota bacterium]